MNLDATAFARSAHVGGRGESDLARPRHERQDWHVAQAARLQGLARSTSGRRSRTTGHLLRRAIPASASRPSAFQPDPRAATRCSPLRKRGSPSASEPMPVNISRIAVRAHGSNQTGAPAEASHSRRRCRVVSGPSTVCGHPPAPRRETAQTTVPGVAFIWSSHGYLTCRDRRDPEETARHPRSEGPSGTTIAARPPSWRRSTGDTAFRTCTLQGPRGRATGATPPGAGSRPASGGPGD